MQLAEDFRDVLTGVDLEGLDRSQSTAFALRPDLTLAYTNDAWERFALANDGRELARIQGRRSILEAIAPPLRAFYRRLYERVFATARSTDHEYLCHSPSVFRRIRMHLTPLPGGLLSVHHLIVSAEHDEAPQPAIEERYIGPTGYATQCCHCRATQRVDAPDTWDWVPALLDRDRHDVSHGLCPVCFAAYHPEAARRRRAWREEQDEER